MDNAAGPSKKPRMTKDLNDSFYDSEEDELVSQACCVTPKTSSAAPVAGQRANATTPVSLTMYGRSAAAAPTNFGTPLSSSGRMSGGGFASATRPINHLPTSATTLKGKPLAPPSSTAMEDDDDVSVIHTSKPFFRLAKEVKELSEERDTLKGHSLFLEQSLRTKEKESQEHLQRITELTQKYAEALEEVREVQRRSDEELVHLRTQLQFQTEQTKADTFKGGKLGASAADEMERPALAAVQNVGKSARVPVIKPRMSTSSVNKSFSSALKPRLSRGVGNVSGLEDEIETFTEQHSDENGASKEMEDKCIQTDAFRIADIITNPDILAKREVYDAVLNTMIGSTFIIGDANENDERVAERSAAAFDRVLGVDGGEGTLNEILNGK